MASNFLQRSRHGSVFYFRRRIPNDLCAAGLPRQIFRSLQPTDRREALVRARALAVQSDQLFNRVRLMTKKKGSMRTDYAIEFELDDYGRVSGVKIDAEPRPTHRRKATAPRWWRSRADPFEHTWPTVEQWLQSEPGVSAKDLMHRLVAMMPDVYSTTEVAGFFRTKKWGCLSG